MASTLSDTSTPGEVRRAGIRGAGAQRTQETRPSTDPLRYATFKLWVFGALVVSVGGAAFVFAFLSFSAPILLTPAETQRLVLRCGIALIVLVLVGVPALLSIRRRQFAGSTQWLRERRAPTTAERKMVLGAPGEAVRMSAIAWLVCAVVFALIGATETASASVYIFGTVALGGISTSAVLYLIVEWIMRPISARALEGGPTDRRVGPCIQHRLATAWLLATGVPLLGVGTLAVGSLADIGFQPKRTFAAILILVIVGLAVGSFTIGIAARSVAIRVSTLRSAFALVQAGDFDTKVVVDDASEIGRLQAGFNTMAAGLAERERIRDVFGTYVDRDVAAHILQGGKVLEADEVEVTIMFVDVRGFTSFAENLPPTQVVATLNRLFERIVPLVHRHGGHVDKYAGDGLMAVFGAPRPQADHADRALAAALQIAPAVHDEFDGTLSVGVGLNSGPVVAGNVGGAGRLEFSVIGDTVNVAARVESATRQTGDLVLLTEHTLALLAQDNKGDDADFIERLGLTLRGKSTPVQIYAPAGATG